MAPAVHDRRLQQLRPGQCSTCPTNLSILPTPADSVLLRNSSSSLFPTQDGDLALSVKEVLHVGAVLNGNFTQADLTAALPKEKAKALRDNSTFSRVEFNALFDRQFGPVVPDAQFEKGIFRLREAARILAKSEITELEDAAESDRGALRCHYFGSQFDLYELLDLDDQITLEEFLLFASYLRFHNTTTGNFDQLIASPFLVISHQQSSMYRGECGSLPRDGSE